MYKRQEYATTGPWTTETIGRLYFRPPPSTRLLVRCRRVPARIQMHQGFSVRVTVQDADGAGFTDDLCGGEIELQVIPPSNRVYYLASHQDFPGASTGHFQIDFDPVELGKHRLALMFNDQVVQTKLSSVLVQPTHFKKSGGLSD